MKYAFSNKRNITGAFPISSRRATNTDWKLFDIHDDDGSETLSARSRPIFPQDEDEMREVSKKSKRFWESKGIEQKNEIPGGHTLPELSQPTPVDIAPKPKARKLKGRLVGKMLEDSRGIMKVEDPRESDVVIP